MTIRTLLTCGPVLLLLSCNSGEMATTVEATEAINATTNIRMARRIGDGDDFREVTEVTRDPDHIKQIMPPIYQFEGPGWENENVGFRLYFDARNGIDIFGKKTREMVLDSVGTGDNYHAMADWGMDILKVGNSLGAGSIAFRTDDGAVYRLGDAREERFRLLEEGLDGSRFVLEYEGLPVGSDSLDLDWVIGIDTGTYAYTATVTPRGLNGGAELLVGIVNLHSDTLYSLEQNGRFIMYTHGPQAEGDHILGMALSVDSSALVDRGEFGAEDLPVGSTYYLVLPLEEGQPSTYTFTAGWAPGNASFQEREEFLAVVR